MSERQKPSLALVSRHTEVVDLQKGTHADVKIFSPNFAQVSEEDIQLSAGHLGLMKALYKDEDLRRTTATIMHNNTARDLDHFIFGSHWERPASANFFLKSDKTVVVQSGAGEMHGEHAVHKNLMKTETFSQLIAEKAFLRSGHVWRIVDGDNRCQVALFDFIEEEDVKSGRVRRHVTDSHILIKALTKAGYLCLSTDGYPVYLMDKYMALAKQLSDES